MSERHFEQSMNPKEHIQSELEDAGISHPSEWRKALDLDTPLDKEEGKIEPIGEKKREVIDLQKLDKIFSYLEGGLRISDRSKIERFGTLTDGLERLKSLQSMSVAEATEAVRDFGLTPGAYNYLARRLEFYQKYIAGEATRKVNTQEWDEKKREYVDVVKEEVIDASQASPETIKLGVIRDIYFAAMQGTPEMGAVKVATNRINRGIERLKQSPKNTSRSVQNPIKSVVEFHGYYSGIFEGSLGQYPEVSQLYKQCEQEIKKRFGNKDLDEKELEHKAVLLTARRLEGAYNYNGTLNTGSSPYNAGFKESITVGQLGHGVMRQMRGMRSKIQETNFSNVERFIGKSGDNRYGFEKKKLDKDVKSLEDFTQDNPSYDASFLLAKSEDGTDRQIKGREAAEIMTRQKNSEAVQRAKLWFGRESDKINHWFEKSKTKIAGYDISEEERNSIYSSVQERYNKKIDDLQQEYQGEIARLENRTPDELLGAFKERQVIVNKRFEKRKSLAQKALDLHFRFNHIGNQKSQEERDQEREHEVNERIKNLEAEYTSSLSHVEDLTTLLERDYPEFKECIFSNEANAEGQDKLSVVYQNYKNKLLGNLRTEYQDRRDRIESQQKTRAHNFEQSGVDVDNAELLIGLQDKLDIWYTKKVSELDSDAQNGLKEFLLLRDNLSEAIDNSKIKNERISALKKVPLGFGQNTVFSGLIDWVNNAPFGIIKRAHRTLSAGVDDQTVMMRALAEVNGESPNDQNPEKFIANILKSGNPSKVIQNFEKFSGITEDQHLNILLAIINSGAGRNVVESLSKFTGIKSEDHLQIVQAMNASGAGDEVISNLDKFSGIKQENKRDILFGAIKGGGGNQVANNLEQFSGIISEKDHRDIVMEMIKAGNCWYLNYGGVLDKFTGLEEPLRQVIKAGKYEAIPHVLEAGFTIEEITRFPFLISPLVTKK